ncbi:MAG: hypothetical protein HYZ31_12000, partial [Gammaproteobacteria bacterium]|nr:hypothetical protein [Gammaproteobacteria bacterium]
MLRLLIIQLFIFYLPYATAGNNNLTFDLMYFDYEEFDPADFSLNHETGFIRGLSATFARNQHELKMSFYTGRVDYDGYTQALTPHQTQTNQTLFKVFYRYHIPPNPDMEKFRYFFGM